MYTPKLLAFALLALPLVYSQGTPCSGSISTKGGRKVSVVVDSSGSMTTNDPQNLRISAGQSIVNSLVSSDRVDVVDFDSSADLVYPLGSPAGANFNGINSLGGTNIASGVKLAIDDLTKNPSDATTHISGIVVLTDGEDTFVTELITELDRAAGLGIRVSFGFLNPSDSGANQAPTILSAIINTHGTYSTIADANSLSNFVSLVLANGLTDNDASNSGGNTLLLPGLVTAGNVSASSSPQSFVYDSQPGEKLNFTVKSISSQSFDVKVVDKTNNKDLQTASTNQSGLATLLLDVSAATTLNVQVSTTNTTAGLFSVGVVSNFNRTISICGATNATSNGNGTAGGGSATNGTAGSGSATNGTGPGTPIASRPPIYTGAASVIKGLAVAAVFPLLVAMTL